MHALRFLPRLRHASSHFTCRYRSKSHLELQLFLSTQSRCLSSSTRRFQSLPASPNKENDQQEIYTGPLAKTFRSLKIFSLSSMGLAAALTPFMFVIQTSLPNVARVALAATALTTSGISTALVAWCGQPYVAKAYTLPDAKQEDGSPTSESLADGIQLETFDIFLRPRLTNVYDTSFLIEAKRPFAKWELAESLSVQKPDSDVPNEELVAETLTGDGRVLGRWIVSWDENKTHGVCRAEGKVQKYVVLPFHSCIRLTLHAQILQRSRGAYPTNSIGLFELP